MIVDIKLSYVRDLTQILRAVFLLIYKVRWIVKAFIGLHCFLVLLVLSHYELKFIPNLDEVLNVLETQLKELLSFAREMVDHIQVLFIDKVDLGYLRLVSLVQVEYDFPIRV